MSDYKINSNIVLNFNEKFSDAGYKYLVHQGGTSSGKTFNNLIFLLGVLLKQKNKLITVTSENVPHLLKGAFRDFNNILSYYNLNHIFDYKGYGRIFTNKITNSQIEFQCFDTIEKAKGGRRDYSFVNEAYAIPYQIAEQLFIRTKILSIIDFNPVSEFWVHSEINKRADAKTLITTYKDNSFLDASIINEIESRKANENWFRVYGLGLLGNLENCVFQNINLIDKFPDDVKYIYGLDLGYSPDPTVLVKVGIRGNEIFIEEKFRLFNSHQQAIINELFKIILNKNDVIITDTNEPRLINAIYDNGFNVHNAMKLGRIEQVNEMSYKKINIVKSSPQCIKEFRQYMRLKDRRGQVLNDFQKFDDHSIDASRYAFNYLTNQQKGSLKSSNTK